MTSLGRWEWSCSKENYTPNESRSEKEKVLDRQANGFESLIRSESKSSLKLKHWLEYMKWSETNQGPDAQFHLMERCVQSCIHQCKDDVRYIEVCVRYADKTSFPPDVFKYLHQHNVGSKVALFWIAWAWVAETIGDFAFCEKVYKKGIAKEAVPLALLQQRQKQFQRRMSRHWLNSSKQHKQITEKDGHSIDCQREPRNQLTTRDTSASSRLLAPNIAQEGDQSCELESQQRRKGALQKQLNYVDPRFAVSHSQRAAATEGKAKGSALINCGFNKEVVAKDAQGQDCCFEEYRAKTGCFTLLMGRNVNRLAMEESVEEVSMETDEFTVASKESVASRRVLFAANSSIDEYDHKKSFLNTSTASSTVSRFIGMSVSREEETINTKFAMKELSMMFSSPAMGIIDGHNTDCLKRPRLNDSQSFDGPLVEEDSRDQIDNSILQAEPNAAEKRPFQIYSESPKGFQIFTETDDSKRNESSLHIEEERASPPSKKQGLQIFCDENQEPADIVVKRQFPIFTDTEEGAGVQHKTEKRGLRVHKAEEKDLSYAQEKGFQIFSDENEMTQGTRPMTVSQENSSYRFSGENNKSSDNGDAAKRKKPPRGSKTLFKDISIVHETQKQESCSDTDDAGGDTATFSLFDDALNSLKDASQSITTTRFSPKSATQDRAGPAVVIQKKTIQVYDEYTGDGDDSVDRESNGVPGCGDTATFSVFGDAMDALNEISLKKPPLRPSDMSPCRDDSIANVSVDDFMKYRPTDNGSVLIDGTAFGDISIIDADSGANRMSPTTLATESSGKSAFKDYASLHKENVRLSLRQLSNEARPMIECVPFSNPETDLVLTLSKKGNIVELPNQALPRGLKRKTSIQGEEIKVGSRTGIVKQELGRGSYGVVVLLDSEREGTIAVKAQSPTDCLAWEYVVMKRLEDRCTIDSFPFPRPLSFVSLADGAMLGMTAGSQHGMNLVDISNVYKVQEGCQVPELIVLHYTARMLKHIETLHWHGKILHCDVKPDNWVVVDSECAFDGCSEIVDSADLMLVDFGRSVDLMCGSSEGIDSMDLTLSGQASDHSAACPAMRMKLGWSFDIDTFGICASAHVLLYGSHLEMDLDRSKRWKIRKPLRRYWQKELWSDFFDSLLNDAIASRPGSLRQRREVIEDYLKTKKKDLEYLLKHQGRILPKKRLD